jgi:hypothetical protein
MVSSLSAPRTMVQKFTFYGQPKKDTLVAKTVFILDLILKDLNRKRNMKTNYMTNENKKSFLMFEFLSREIFQKNYILHKCQIWFGDMRIREKVFLLEIELKIDSIST